MASSTPNVKMLHCLIPPNLPSTLAYGFCIFVYTESYIDGVVYLLFIYIHGLERRIMDLTDYFSLRLLKVSML